MRVTRIRKFKKSSEVTLVLEGNDAQALCHAIDCSKKTQECIFPERFALGQKLLEQLNEKVAKVAWRQWQD